MRGGNSPFQISCNEFRAWSDSCNLTHLVTRGAKFTWIRRRKNGNHIERRLDRAVVNDDWLSFWNASSCCTLTRSQSDNYPLLLVASRGVKSFASPFMFQ